MFIPVLKKGYCLFASANLNSERSAIFGLTLSALHRLQMKQYFPRLRSSFLNPIIRKVCWRWAFTCSTPWWPQSWCAFSIYSLAILLLLWRTRGCFALYVRGAFWSLPPTLKSPSSSRKGVKGISLSPFSKMSPFNSAEIVPESSSFWDILMR